MQNGMGEERRRGVQGRSKWREEEEYRGGAKGGKRRSTGEEQREGRGGVQCRREREAHTIAML